jgi:hypothetical protein
MLLSHNLALVAAFDHRDIFLDPDPDPERSWLERRRLYDLPGSSWQDYDRTLISAGGGVHSRRAKSVPLTDEVRELLGIDTAALTPDERSAIERHPLYTWEVLSHVSAFAELAGVASSHHEKLDGSGYPWGLTAEQLDFPSRILVVADIYEALTADRPYRAGMSREDALAIINRDRGSKLCANAIDALEAHTLALAELPIEL